MRSRWDFSLNGYNKKFSTLTRWGHRVPTSKIIKCLKKLGRKMISFLHSTSSVHLNRAREWKNESEALSKPARAMQCNARARHTSTHVYMWAKGAPIRYSSSSSSVYYGHACMGGWVSEWVCEWMRRGRSNSRRRGIFLKEAPKK